MAESYQFHLARWNERDKHLKCPGCGRGKGCFKEYVDDNGNPVDCENHTVGKCDHANSCGYHLTPKEWFKLGNKASEMTGQRVNKKDVLRIEVDPKLVGQFHRQTKAVGNTFLRWVESLPLTEEQRQCLPYLIDFYAIGTTKDGRIIWWQIDENRVVRTGKIMLYDETGHRCKDEEGNSIGFSWVHAMLGKKFGMYRENDERRYELMQCLFGQHLLPVVPDAEIHIVESEKTALLMSLFDDLSFTNKHLTTDKKPHIWMATGGLFNLNQAKLAPLKGRTIFCYPDANGIDKWKECLKGTNAKLVTGWMANMTKADGKGADIADVILRKKTPQPPLGGDTQPTEKQPPTTPPSCDWSQDIKNNPIVQLLIEKLQLYEE